MSVKVPPRSMAKVQLLLTRSPPRSLGDDGRRAGNRRQGAGCKVHFALPVVDQVDEPRVNGRIFAHALTGLPLAVDEQFGPAFLQAQFNAVRPFDGDGPFFALS